MPLLQAERDGRGYATITYKAVKPARTAVRCPDCGHMYMQSIATGQPDYCPKCFKENLLCAGVSFSRQA